MPTRCPAYKNELLNTATWFHSSYLLEVSHTREGSSETQQQQRWWVVGSSAFTHSKALWCMSVWLLCLSELFVYPLFFSLSTDVSKTISSFLQHICLQRPRERLGKVWRPLPHFSVQHIGHYVIFNFPNDISPWSCATVNYRRNLSNCSWSHNSTIRDRFDQWERRATAWAEH